MITSDEVLNAKFQATKFREGYDQDEVDDLLDRVVATLRGRETGTAASAPVSVAELDALALTPTKFREGYDIESVDALLARVRETLAGASAPTGAVAPPPTDGTAVPGLIQPAKGWRRLFGG